MGWRMRSFLGIDHLRTNVTVQSTLSSRLAVVGRQQLDGPVWIHLSSLLSALGTKRAKSSSYLRNVQLWLEAQVLN
jgi:hypothetical protein